MHSYLVFAGEKYYPSGGWSDFLWAFETLAAAEDYIQALPHQWGYPNYTEYGWAHIVHGNAIIARWKPRFKEKKWVQDEPN